MISLGPTVPRCLGVWGGVTAAGALVCRGVAADLRVAGDADLETWLVAVAAAALVLAACWASAVAGVVCLQVARRAPVPRAGVPAPVEPHGGRHARPTTDDEPDLWADDSGSRVRVHHQ